MSLTSPEQRFFLMSIVNSMPSEWRSLAEACTSISLNAPILSTSIVRKDISVRLNRLSLLYLLPRRHRINWAFTLFLPSICGVLATGCDLVKG